MLKWSKRMLLAGLAGSFLLLLVVVPVGGSFLLTNSRFRFPELVLSDPENADLTLEQIEFVSSDDVALKGWWNSGQAERPVLIFVHGLNRTHTELLERAAAASRRGYGVLLFDLRNHGDSGDAYTTLGVHESRDVCAAMTFVASSLPVRRMVLWGVSLGASTALLAAKRCPGADAVIADSSFLSFEETVARHFRLIFGLPPFPIANLMITLTKWRMGFQLEDGDVELAVRNNPALALLLIAGERDRRMPPEVARRLYDASKNPQRQLLIVPGAEHGRAFHVDPGLYLKTVFAFLDVVDLRQLPTVSGSSDSDRD